MSEANKPFARGFYDDINRGDLSAFIAKLADDFIEHEAFPGIPPTKRACACTGASPTQAP